jgi:UDP-N-acetylglucosamine 2-epimerase
VLVLRQVSERPEAIRTGVVRLVSTDPQRIFAEACRLLSDPVAYAEMARPVQVYGDGLASARIAEVVLTGKMATPAFHAESAGHPAPGLGAGLELADSRNPALT